MGDVTAPPTPDGVPLLGNGWAFSRDPVGAMESWAELGDVVHIQTPGQSLYMVTDPELIRRILVDDHHAFTIGPSQQEMFRGVEDHAMTTATGNRWKRLRRAAHPAFTRRRIDAYGDRMAETAATCVEEWDDGETFDLNREMRLLTVNVLADTLLDVDIRGREPIVMDAADALVDRGNFRRPGQLLPDWVPTPTDRRFARTVRELDEFVDEVLAERQSRSGNEAGEGGEDEDGDASSDVCSVLLDAHEAGTLSFEEVRHNVVALLLAGHESPSTALTFAWYLLSEHPETYESLVAEYDDVVDADRPAGEDCDALERTENVVSETLRLYPPTAGINRQAVESVTLGGYEFSEGSQFMIPQWVVHRDERFWDDPESFDPSRWDEDGTDEGTGASNSDRPEYAYFPFSGGPRQCIGNDFARQELTLALATMVGRVEPDVSLDEPLTFTPSVALRPETDIEATVHHRQ